LVFIIIKFFFILKYFILFILFNIDVGNNKKKPFQTGLEILKTLKIVKIIKKKIFFLNYIFIMIFIYFNNITLFIIN